MEWIVAVKSPTSARIYRLGYRLSNRVSHTHHMTLKTQPNQKAIVHLLGQQDTYLALIRQSQELQTILSHLPHESLIAILTLLRPALNFRVKHLCTFES